MFPALSFSLHSSFSRWGTYQTLVVASQGVPLRPAALSSLETQENHEGRGGLAVNLLYHLDKASLPKHCYILQNLLIIQAVQLTLYTMENSIPFMGSSPKSGQTQDDCDCRFAGCNAFPVVCKITGPNLLSLSLL